MGSGNSNLKGGTRGQSSPIALVLVIGMVLASTTVIVAIGAVAIDDSRGQLGTQSASNAMTQMSSEISMVAGTGANSQSVSLPDGNGGSYGVNNSSGTLTITAVNETDTEQLLETELGTVTYENGNSLLAYQGGGVWRGTGNETVMVSPPDVVYSDGTNATLTVRAINISGNSTIDSEATITQMGEDTSGQSLHSNLEDRNINITVTSDYYRGWGLFFETRTNTEVTYHHDTNTVTAQLVPPPTPVEIDSGVVGSGDLTISSGSAQVDGPVELGGTLDEHNSDSVTGTVEENQAENTELEEASSEISNAGTRLSGEPSISESADSSNSRVEAGSYYVSDDDIFSSDTTFDTENGDIELFVDGDIDQNKDVEIEGDGNVTIYVAGDFRMSGQATWGNSSNVDSLMLYSDSVSRITGIYGILYTDAVSLEGSGSGLNGGGSGEGTGGGSGEEDGGGPGEGTGGGPSEEDGDESGEEDCDEEDGEGSGDCGGSNQAIHLQGALISTADDIEMSGNVGIRYEQSLGNTVLEDVQTEYATVVYLHVSEERVRID